MKNNAMTENKNWNELFDFFCDENNVLHPWMAKPFLNTSYQGTIFGDIWATDGYLVLIISSKLVGTNFDKFEQKTFIPEILPEDKQKVVTIKSLQAALEQCDKEEIIEEEEFECPECNGEGKVTWEYSSTTGKMKTYEREEDCPVCDGNGYTYKETPSGKFRIANGSGVSIGLGSYNGRLMERIVKAMKWLDVDSFKVLSKPIHNKMVFLELVKDEIKVGLMPALCDKKVVELISYRDI